jgi:prenyltransferase beta subunit
MVHFLQEAQNADGGFGGEPKEASNPDFSAWVALALTAAGINPQDQARPNGVDALTYLGEHAHELEVTTDFERVLLVVDAAGTPPHDFGGIDLVNQILARKLPDGSFRHEAAGTTPGVNDTTFAILSLSPIHEPDAEAAVQQATSWIEHEQYAEGSWPPVKPMGEAGEVDMTGAALEALSAAGRHSTPAQNKALAFLHSTQRPSGGFPEKPGGVEANVASTAWAVQGIWASGENPETWLSEAGAEPLGYLESMQQPDGHVRFEQRKEENGIWMTAYAAPAMFGRQLPLAQVPREARPPATSGAVTGGEAPGTAQAGNGGDSSRPGSGVIAGGGGEGAALFSRPLPASKGHAPGGVRQLRRARHERTVQRRREPNVHQSAATVTVAPESASLPMRTGAETPSTGKLEAGGHAAVPGAGAGDNASARPHVTASGGGAASTSSEIHGVLIATPPRASELQPGAPGLHGAGAGDTETPWLSIAIGAAAALLALAGSQLERRRGELIV